MFYSDFFMKIEHNKHNTKKSLCVGTRGGLVIGTFDNQLFIN